MQQVDRNPFLQENFYNHLAKFPISAMVNELNKSDTNVAVGGIAAFSKVNDNLKPQSKRFKPGWEIALSSAHRKK